MVEPELFLDCFFFGCKQLGSSDGVSGGSILPLELLMLHPSRGSVCGWNGRGARVLTKNPSSCAVGSGCGLWRSVWQGPVESWEARSLNNPVQTVRR